MRKAQGFSLIELMIVIAILAFLVLAAAPLSGAWVQDADLHEVEGSLTQAVGRAKAAALRNYAAAENNQPVTAICIANNTVSVRERTASAAPDCATPAGTLLWQDAIDEDVSIKANTVAVSCMCFNNRGFLTSDSCAGCNTLSTLTLTAGSKNVSVTIH